MENVEFKIDQTNIEQQKAFEFIANTNISFFVTGKAGTGKTTFIRGVQKLINKNILVLAPTGISAMNVGGQTIHSFLGLPFDAIGPDAFLEISLEKRQTLEYTDTIIIDEASMVRCDWVDCIDRFLRSLMHTHLPFGGKQLVFVGDLFQLPPVVKHGSADDEMLCDMYGSGKPYFYKANVMRRMNMPKIELQKVYRQEDKDFLEILNRMRVGESTDRDLNTLNQHVSPNDEVGDFSVTLTAYTRIADSINEQKLYDIEEDEFCYEGEVDGDFRVQDSPAPMKLKLKVGAQVIFCRNDYLRGCVNGTIAKVIALSETIVKVILETGREVNVEKMVWESRKSVYNRKTQTVESEIVGSFTQYPLKLAWAITIHKSQGMTFDRMHFDLTRGTFAAGQTYVAISRMRTLDGLTLSNKIRHHHIMQNAEIKAFANSFNDFPQIDDELVFGRLLYNHLQEKDYDNAAKVCLLHSLKKIKSGDYRNAALLAKKMYDVMLDDKCLNGLTKDIPLLKDCSMTCHFLNAVLCLYSNRLDEAIGYADMVLDRRSCLEAMFIKGKALQGLKRYDEAMEIDLLIREISGESKNNIAIDQKQYLFEAELNNLLGKFNIDTCINLMKLVPEYPPIYLLIRKGALANCISIEMKEDEEENYLITSFNDTTISDEDFKKLIESSNKTGLEFKIFSRKIREIQTSDC